MKKQNGNVNKKCSDVFRQDEIVEKETCPWKVLDHTGSCNMADSKSRPVKMAKRCEWKRKFYFKTFFRVQKNRKQKRN